MTVRKGLLWTVLALLLGSMAAGCGKGAENSVEAPAEDPVEEERVDAEQPEEETEAQIPEEQPEAQAPEERQDFSFADVADREFYFSSGAGGWYTVLHIQEDGSFDGHYQDSDMGDIGEGYPNGTIYYSEFSGSFTEPERVDDWTYRFQIEEINYPLGSGDEIKDGIHYCYTTAYGLDGAEDLYLYLPGKSTAELPEEYLSWISYYDPESAENEGLPFYGLYNEKQQEGFSSSVRSGGMAEEATGAEAAHDWAVQIGEKALAAQEKADQLEEEIKNAQSQADMNGLSGELYKVWDDALNEIWGILTEHMDSEEMDRLTEEERLWIQQKEEAVQEAGADVEGGTLYPLVTNEKAAELTRERVYELASLAGAPLDAQ